MKFTYIFINYILFYKSDSTNPIAYGYMLN